MVSSRCVDELPNGNLPVSPSVITNIAINAKISCGCETNEESADAVTMPLMFEPPYVRDTTNIVRNNAGSKSIDIIISLLLPNPPKELDTSRPASIVKNLARANRPMTSSISPTNPNGEYERNTGIKNAAVPIATKLIHGDDLKIHELWSDTTMSLRTSLMMS